MKKDLTEMVFILDRSGSMHGLEAETIGGFNAMLEKQRKIDGECLVTTVLFDHEYKLLHDRVEIKEVSKLTHRDYEVGGSTALRDAIGMTINKLVNAQRHTAEIFRAEKVMFVIITDGEENASREFSQRKIKNMIEYQKGRYGWEFIFIGANIDAAETAKGYGIGKDRSVDYLADSEGTEVVFGAVSHAMQELREEACISEAFHMQIKADTKKRGGKR